MKAPADLDINQLCVSAQRARLVLRFPREERVMAVKLTAGIHNSEEGSEMAQPLNLISMYRTIVGRKLVANNPRAMLQTDVKDAKPVVAAMETWVNKQIVNINLVETLQRAVDDSLYCLGVVKVSLADPGMAANFGWAIRAGEPFAETIDLDDFVFDVHARRFDQCSFIGHRYRIPLKVAQKIYGKSRNLEATDDSLYNMEGDERISVIGRTTVAGYDELEPMIDLWEFYLPRHKLIVTLRDDDMGGTGGQPGKALDIKPWLGPQGGPYHILSMGYLPGNPMPVSPIQNLIDLHESVNEMMRKLMEQASRQKTVTIVEGSASKDAANLSDTNDGGMMYADRIGSIHEIGYGGPNQNNFQLMNAFKDLFSWVAGNLDSLGGLGPQSKTAAQDEMLQQNSSATVSDMQQRAIAHAASVVEALCWFWHHDPFRVMKVTYSLPGMPQITVPQQIHPMGQSVNPANGKKQMSRDHSFEDMNLRIDPYSMQYSSPQQRLAALNNVVQTILTPLMPILQTQGVAFDVQAYLQKVAKLGDMTDLPEIVKMASVQPDSEPQGPSQPDAPTMPANTSRTYTRRSEGGATNKGQAMASANAMSTEPTKNGQPNA